MSIRTLIISVVLLFASVWVRAGQAAVPSPNAQSARLGSFSSGSEGGGSKHLTQATPEQSFLFQKWAGSSSNFYDLTRTSTYLLNAKGEPIVEFSKLQASAGALFDAQQQFVATLTGVQRRALRSQLRAVERLRHDAEKQLNWLAAGTATSPASTSYVKTVRKLKSDLEHWNTEQQRIALQLGMIQSSAMGERNSWSVHWGTPVFGWRPKNR